MQHFWKIGIPVLLTAWLVYAIWPRPFELSISPPIDNNGTRIQLLVPRGWSESVGPGDPMYKTYITFGYRPTDSPTWWPTFLRRWFPPLDQNSNFLAIVVVDPEVAKTYSDMFKQMGGAAQIGPVSAQMAIDVRPIAPKSAAVLIYMRDNREMLDRTKSIIFASFRLLPGDPRR